MAKEIKNYLKSVKDITAPLNWKSAPDSPPTQLAYITQPEIDMLVKANIHGSMNGKPNMGPKGIISLDGFGAYDSDSVVSKPDQKKYESAGGASQSSYDKPGAGSMVINNVDYGQAYQDEQDISGGTNEPVSGVSFGDQQNVTTPPKKDEPVKKKFNIQDTFEFLSKFSPLAQGGKLFGAGIEKLFGTKPKANQFTNANDLAIIKSLFTNEKGRVDKDKLNEYYDQYKITIGEGLTSDEASGETAKFFEEQGIIDPTKLKEEFQNAIMGAEAPQGSEAQRRLDPEAYYDRELFLKEGGEQAEMLKNYPKFLSDMGLKPMSSRFANTTGNLVDKANIDVNTPGLSEEFKQEIFNARMELDRMGKDRSGNTQGVMSTPAFAIAPGQDAPPKPGPGFTPDEPSGPSFTPQNTSPFDLSQFYAGLPSYSYGQQGVMSPNINPDLASYYENLKKYYGVG